MQDSAARSFAPAASGGGMADWMRTEALSQARRWAKFPATVLFALCVLWLVRCYMFEGSRLGEIKNQIETGLGAATVFFSYFVLPLGSAIAGIGLLTLHRWAYPLAALLPVYPMLDMSASKIARIGGKFHAFHESAALAGGPDTSKLGDGLIDCLLLIGAWAAFLLMLYYLWRSLSYLAPAKSRHPLPMPAGLAPSATAPAGTPSIPPGAQPMLDDEGDVCFLLPETRDDAIGR